MRQLDEKWLSSSSTALLGRYRGKYVAVREKRILAASSTMKVLYRKLDELNPGMVLIAKIEKPTLRARDFRDLSGLYAQKGIFSGLPETVPPRISSGYGPVLTR